MSDEIAFRTPACKKHLPNNEDDVCPWCRIAELEAVYKAARGMCHGYDWNKGTAAGYHRVDLVRAVNAIDPLPDQGRTELIVEA